MAQPTLPDLPQDDASSELQDAAKSIVNISKVGDGYLITLADGQEIILRPGDAHTVGPVDRATTYDANDGEGPNSLHELYHQGELPADLHQMIQAPAQPTAAEAGLISPALPDLPTPDEGTPDEEAQDPEDIEDGGADEAEEGEEDTKKAPPKGKAKGKVASVSLPDY